MNIYPSGSLIANRYEVVKAPDPKRHILAGGMGMVYLCNDRAEDRPVALKTFQPEYLPDRKARESFLREGDIWVKLEHHPNVVCAYSVERIGDGREVYLVLEWVAEAEGKRDASLRAWLAPGKPLPVEQALLFALHIARGMKHAVTKVPGLVHRDLKPENVLVGRDGYARVTDFGLVKALAESATGLDAMGSVEQSVAGGTPWYMAPEQWEPRALLDARADIYALGCMVYEMLTGKMAMIEKANELRRAHREGRAAERARELKGDIGELVRKCLAVERDKRYRSWTDVEEALVRAYRRMVGKDALGEVAAAAATRVERVAAGWSYNAIGASYSDIGKFEVALGYFKRALKISQKEKKQELEGETLGEMGNAYADLGDVQKAIRYYEQHLKIARKIGDRIGEGNALDNLGSVYKELNEARRAIGYHEQALAIARETGNRRGEGNALGNLGEAFRVLGDTRRAIRYYEQALVIDHEIGDRSGEGADLGNLGVAYFQLGDARRAIGYQEQRLEIAREIGGRRGEGNALGNLGNAYMTLGDARRAIEYYEQAMVIRREIGDINGIAIDSFNMAVLYAQQGEPGRALPLAQEAARIYTQIGHAQYAQDAQQLVAKLRQFVRK